MIPIKTSEICVWLLMNLENILAVSWGLKSNKMSALVIKSAKNAEFSSFCKIKLSTNWEYICYVFWDTDDCVKNFKHSE